MARKKTLPKPLPDFIGNPKPYIMLTQQMFRSPAFRKLSNSARTAYLLLRDQQENVYDERVMLTYRQVEPFMRSQAWKQAIDQLKDGGFIVLDTPGGMYRMPNVYRFVSDWKKR